MPQLVTSRHVKVTEYLDPPSTSVTEAASNATCFIMQPDKMISRPTPLVKTPKGPFRPFTTYSVSGWATQGIPFGQLAVDEFSSNKIERNTYDTWVTNVVISDPVFPAVDASSHDGVVSRAYAKAKTSGFDWLTEVSEFPEVFRMLNNVKKGIINCLRMAFAEAKKQDWWLKKLKKRITLTELMNFWLQGRYGWRPLYKSIMDLIDTLESLELGKYIATGGDKNVRVVSGSDSAITKFCIASGKALPLNVATVSTQTVRGRAALFLTPNTVAFNGNLARTAWELVPLSFVVDWFFNVGGIITEVQESICPTRGTACYSIDNRTIVRITTGFEQIPASTATLQVRASTPIDMYYEKFSYTRVVVPSLNPQLRLVNRLDPLKGLDLVALVNQWAR